MSSDAITSIANELVVGADDLAQRLHVIAAALRAGQSGIPPMTDLRGVLPVNLHPDEPWLVAHGYTDWWERAPADITGITIHHVSSHGTPQATAAYITRSITRGGKGYPRTQYHFWIEPDGEILYCLDLRYGCWHDNCGHRNQHVSVVLNGALHLNPPTALQLASVARLVAWLMDEHQIELANVEGHREWAHRALGRWVTECPGWATILWRAAFFATLAAARGINAATAFSARSDALATAQISELDTMQRGADTGL